MHEPIGVLTAMPDEMRALLAALETRERIEHGRRVFAVGTLFGREAVLVEARIGKVAAAAAATELIARFGVRTLLFTGLAGGLAPGIAVGDIVVGEELAQHDLDASPLFPAMEIPLLGRSRLPADADLSERLARAAAAFLGEDLRSAFLPQVIAELGIGVGNGGPRVHRGLVVSGDRFVSSDAEATALRGRVPGALCVEMEGAAVAQVAYEYGIPFGIVRAISDAADDHAATAFPKALGTLAAAYASGILRRALG